MLHSSNESPFPCPWAADYRPLSMLRIGFPIGLGAEIGMDEYGPFMVEQRRQELRLHRWRAFDPVPRRVHPQVAVTVDVHYVPWHRDQALAPFGRAIKRHDAVSDVGDAQIEHHVLQLDA